MKKSSKELKRMARNLLNNRYGTFMAAFVLASVITTAIELPFSLSANDNPTVMQQVVLFLAEYLILLIGQVLSVGVVLVHLNMTRNREYKIRQMFEPFLHGAERYFGAAFLLSVLSLLCCVPLIAAVLYFSFTDLSALSVCILVGASVLTLILALLLILNYNFVSFLLLDYPQMKVTAAFRECRLMMQNKKGRLLYLLLSFLGWGFLIVCSLGIAALWVSPYMTQTMVNFYLDCKLECPQ